MPFLLGVKTRKEVAQEYGITVNTLKSRLKQLNIKLPPGLLFPKTLAIIYRSLGVPKGSRSE
jgi:hypothetical protein